MRSTVCKTFTFHAAHVIPHHQGKCSQPHGHTYRVDVYASGVVQDTGPEAGMVVDFDRIKQAWVERLEPFLDHRDLNVSLVDAGLIPHSTAECIAAWILYEFRRVFGRDAMVDRVRVWETPTSFAEAQ